MAITWGAERADSSNAFKTGYEFSQSPASVANGTTSVTVTLRIYLATKYYAYDSSINWSITGSISGSGTASFNHSSSSPWSSSNVTLVATRTRTVSPSFASTVATSITANINGLTAIAGTASVAGTWTTAKRPIAAPDAPTGLTNTRISDNQTNLAWNLVNPTDPSAPCTNIEVERYDTATGAYARIAILGAVSTYSATGQLTDKRYYYRVRATNSAGASGYSTAGPIYTTPDAPTNLKIIRSGVSSIQLTWTDNALYNDQVEIWEYINGVKNGSPLTTVGNVASYLHPSPTTNQKHSYSLRAITTGAGATYSAYSAVSNAIQLSDDPPKIPLSVTPVTSTITVPNPPLGGTLQSITTGQRQKMVWQFAANTAFTGDVREVEEQDTDLRLAGATTESPTISMLGLPNGIWYMRGVALDENGIYGPFSSTQALTVNTPAPTTPTAVKPAAGSSVTTMTPTLEATQAVDSIGRKVRLEFNLAKDSGFTSGLLVVLEPVADQRTSGVGSEIVPIGSKVTGNGLWYLRARTVSEEGGVSAWTATQSFTLAMPAPPVPTTLTPVDQATVSTNFPTLGVVLQPATEGRKVKAEWQFATNAGFTTGVKTFTESAGDLRTSGATTEIPTPGSGLTQGLWYYRARALDEYDQPSAYTATQGLTVSHKPSGAPLAPSGDSTLPYTGSIELDWAFSDPERTDSQKYSQVVVERNDTGASVFDSGKITSTLTSSIIAVTSLLKDVKLRWRVMVWDQDNVASNWSAYQLFNLSEPPMVTITLPSVGQELGTGQPTINWSTDAQTTQSSFRVIIRRTVDDVLILDTNVISSSNKTYTAPGTILQNTVDYTVTVRVNDIQGLTGETTNPFTTVYQSPDEVIYFVDAEAFETLGYMDINWSQTQPDGFFVQWSVYRRMTGASQWDLLAEYLDPSIISHHDWTATAGDTWQYAVTQLGGRSGLILESPISPTPESNIAGSTHYWLINPLDESNNLKLDNVTSDDFTDPYEEAELIVIGRGRKMNLGTRIGYDGSLSCKLRDDEFETARSKRNRLQRIKAARAAYFIRTPFGDLYQVSLGGLSFSRVAGVGTNEYVDVTIPYKEVF